MLTGRTMSRRIDRVRLPIAIGAIAWVRRMEGSPDEGP